MKFLSILLLAGTVLTATPVTTQVTFKDGGNHGIGPYTVTMNGVDYFALCVDFLHTATLGATWNVYVSDFSNISHTYNPGKLTAYKEEAYLYSLLMQPNADRLDIQHAAWHITDPDYEVNAAAQNFITLAQTNYGSLNMAGFQILSSVSNPRQQEFLIYNASAVPEPGSFLLLAGGLLVAGGIARRRVREAGSDITIQ